MFDQFINESLVLPRYEKGGRVDHTEYHNVLHVLDPREQPVRATIYHTGAIGNCCRNEVLLKSALIKDLSWPEPRGLDLCSVNVSITAAERLKPRARKLRWFHQSFLWRHSDLLILRGWNYPAERPQSIPADRIILDLPMLRTQVEEVASAKASHISPEDGSV